MYPKHQAIPNARKATVSFEKDVVFGSELDQVFVLMVVVWVEENLLEVTPLSRFWRGDTCLIYSWGDGCDFQDFPEVVNSEVANADAPVEVDALSWRDAPGRI